MRRRILLWRSMLAGSAVIAAPLSSIASLAKQDILEARNRNDHAESFLASVFAGNVSPQKVAEVGSHKMLNEAVSSLSADSSFDDLLSLSGYLPTLKSTEFVSAFRLQRDTDFLDSRTLLLDGWVVARAEVALCILFSKWYQKGQLA